VHVWEDVIIAGNVVTYPKDGWVIRYPGGLRLWGLVLLLRSDADILHITSSEHDVFVNTGGWGNFFGWIPTAPFGAE
jgi:hypothetical protein